MHENHICYKLALRNWSIACLASTTPASQGLVAYSTAQPGRAGDCLVHSRPLLWRLRWLLDGLAQLCVLKTIENPSMRPQNGLNHLMTLTKLHLKSSKVPS